MKFIPHQNVASSLITVTNTATALFSLMNTAGSVTNSQAYHLSPSLNKVGVANGLMITPEDGNVRLGYGITPTSALGTLLVSGTKYFLPNLNLEDIKLIRTSGDVKCSVEILNTKPEDGFSAVSPSGSTTIGTVAIADGDLATLGAKADDKSTATDTTPVTIMSVLKEISYMAQNPVADTPPTTLTGGEKTIATSGTGEALGASLAIRSVYVRAKSTNTGNVYVGDSNVDASSSKQIILSAGDAITLDIANRATVYVDVDVNSEGVDYVCMS